MNTNNQDTVALVGSPQRPGKRRGVVVQSNKPGHGDACNAVVFDFRGHFYCRICRVGVGKSTCKKSAYDHVMMKHPDALLQAVDQGSKGSFLLPL